MTASHKKPSKKPKDYKYDDSLKLDHDGVVSFSEESGKLLSQFVAVQSAYSKLAGKKKADSAHDSVGLFMEMSSVFEPTGLDPIYPYYAAYKKAKLFGREEFEAELKKYLDKMSFLRGVRYLENIFIAKIDGDDEVDFTAKLNDSETNHHYTRLIGFALDEIYRTYEDLMNDKYDTKENVDRRARLYNYIVQLKVPSSYHRCEGFAGNFQKVTSSQISAHVADSKMTSKDVGEVELPDKCKILLQQVAELGQLHFWLKHEIAPDMKATNLYEDKYVSFMTDLIAVMKKAFVNFSANAAYDEGLLFIQKKLESKIPRRSFLSLQPMTVAQFTEYLNADPLQHNLPRLLGFFLYHVGMVENKDKLCLRGKGFDMILPKNYKTKYPELKKLLEASAQVAVDIEKKQYMQKNKFR